MEQHKNIGPCKANG